MSITTTADIRNAKISGNWKLRKNTLFYLRKHPSGDLWGGRVVLKMGTIVSVIKIYRKGWAALVNYIDKSGKLWWSWIHATREM